MILKPFSLEKMCKSKPQANFFLDVKTKPTLLPHDKASNAVALDLRWIYCVVFIVFIPFYRCVKVFLFAKYNCHIFLYINTYCKLGLKAASLRMYTIMSHIAGRI